MGYNCRFEPAEGSRCFGYNNNLIHVASCKRLNSKTKFERMVPHHVFSHPQIVLNASMYIPALAPLQ